MLQWFFPSVLNLLEYPSGDSNGELLAKLCGQTIPTVPIVVFTPELWVHFQTDASQGDLGFNAKYLFSGKTDTDTNLIFHWVYLYIWLYILLYR